MSARKSLNGKHSQKQKFRHERMGVDTFNSFINSLLRGMRK